MLNYFKRNYLTDEKCLKITFSLNFHFIFTANIIQDNKMHGVLYRGLSH